MSLNIQLYVYTGAWAYVQCTGVLYDEVFVCQDIGALTFPWLADQE